MKNKKLLSFRFLLIAVLLSTGFVALKAAEDENGGGSPGCIINPDIPKVGYCMLSTEFEWRCIPSTGEKNCTSSN
jgi:hypothetical protein